jgi:hydroxymethylglutaryl-CoA lyase
MTDAPEKTAVAIVEVGPRDGFQGIGPFIPTPTKIDMLRRLAAAGLKRIEIGSFVSASAVPQLRDTPELLAACAGIPGLIPQVLVPSERRGKDAVQAGAPWLAFVLSVTEAHNRNNVRRHPLESVEEYQRLLALIPADRSVRLNIATAFDCPFTGRVPEAETIALLDRLIAMRADVEVCLCDTTGRADPDHVESLFATCIGIPCARHLWAWACQRPRRLPSESARVRCFVRRVRRLPVRARRDRQCCDRGCGLDVRAHGGCDRD